MSFSKSLWPEESATFIFSVERRFFWVEDEFYFRVNEKSFWSLFAANNLWWQQAVVLKFVIEKYWLFSRQTILNLV